MRTDALAQRISRCLPQTPETRLAARWIADELLTIGAMVPGDDWLVVGGSLARGEPSLIRDNGRLSLLSDIDCLYVHYGDQPSMPVDDLITVAEKTFPTVDLKTISLADYRALGTAIGFEFKNMGLSLTDRGLPPHEPVTLDIPRDAYEILLYYTMAWFWSRCFEQWLDLKQTRDFHLTVNRLCLKILRASAMLDGAYCYHDFTRMDPTTAGLIQTELEWRDDPTQQPLNPGRFWEYLGHAFDTFDLTFGRVRTDAVTWSPYAETSAGRRVAKYHQALNELARHLCYAWTVEPNPGWLATVMGQVWARITGWTGTFQPGDGPEDYFEACKPEFIHYLLAMKVQVV